MPETATAKRRRRSAADGTFATVRAALMKAATMSWVSSGRAYIVTQDHTSKRFDVWHAENTAAADNPHTTVVANVSVPGNLPLAFAESHLELVT